MGRGTLIIIGLVLLGIGVAAGAGGMWLVMTNPIGASAPISAPTLSLDDSGSDMEAVETQVAQLSDKLDEVLAGQAILADMATQIAAGASADSAMMETPMAEVASDPTGTPTPFDESEIMGDTMTGRGLFRVDSELSEVRFIIDEELLGAPKTVIGATDQVAGDIIVNFDQPASSEVGEIRINVRTLETDDENRNRSLRGQILQTNREEFEFAVFVPTAMTGLPEAVGMNQAVTFQLTGDLTVRDITNSVTFEVTATMVSEERLEASATTNVTRDAYGLTIPNVPGVANVSNDVILEMDLVARLVES